MSSPEVVRTVPLGVGARLGGPIEVDVAVPAV